MRWFLILAMLLPLTLLSCSSSEKEYISAAHDGDTFTDSKGTIYRLYGVDTPEVSNQYKGFVPTKGIEALYGEQATECTRDLILDKEVTVKVITTDPYQRVVASVSYNGVDLATKLLDEGLARVAYISDDIKNQYYTSDLAYYKSLLDAQYRAFDRRKGIWERLREMPEIFPKASF